MIRRYEDLVVMNNIFIAICNVLSGQELESEVLERANITMGHLLGNAGDVQKGSFISISIIRGSDTASLGNPESWTIFIPEVKPLISKSHRQTALECMQCLVTLLKHTGGKMVPSLFTSTLTYLGLCFGLAITYVCHLCS